MYKYFSKIIDYLFPADELMHSYHSSLARISHGGSGVTVEKCYERPLC